ncbi:diguanylate cyclase [Uliginosibacterium sp. sgz301328]|uniref:sensor domain-containing diguanylate cyclase n=1 Tax=Uliginosibacterium sp. sgz301328 TaxID=3243764 RepID=UPI00359ECBB0
MSSPIDLSRFEQLKASGDLPSPKGVALAIMRVMQHDDVSMAELARIIRTDPAFVGRLIKAANGLIGYNRRPVASIQDALTVLGLPAVRTMALGFSLLTNYRSGSCSEFDYGHFWSASLLRAVAAQALSQRTRAAAPDETYCLGLLSRVGELALATLYPREYSQLLAAVRGDASVNLLELESREFAMNHAELGAAMLADWGLPRVFTEAAYHCASGTAGSAPEGSRDHVLIQSLSVATLMAQSCLVDDAGRSTVLHRVLAAGSRLGFDEEVMTAMCDDVAREWLEWGALLNVQADRLPPFEHYLREPDTGIDRIVSADPVPTAAPQAPAQAQTQRLRVLVAEADDDIRTTARRALLDAGYDVAEARDGYTATELALDFQPDMMLMAWQLQDVSGVELVKTLRKTRIGRAIYVVALTDSVSEDLLIEAYESGADAVLGKPVNPRLLQARLKAACRLTSLHQEIEHDREEIRHFAAELAVSNRRLQEVALMDSLTGFPNRRFFTDRLTQEWSASSRSGRPLACLMIDIDQFKSINDTYGHDVGDSVLRQVSAAIRQGLRSHDVVARTGGDEFLVMCPDTTLEAALRCAERVRSTVERAEVVAGMLHLRITISAGAAARNAGVVDTDALIKRADQGLYLAKQLGRNRVASVQLQEVTESGNADNS